MSKVTVVSVIGLILVSTIPAFALDLVDRTPANQKRFYVKTQMKFADGSRAASNFISPQVGCKLSEHFALGAEFATIAPRRRGPIEDDPAPENDIFTFAYAGVVASYMHRLDDRWTMNVNLLLGDGYLGTVAIHHYHDQVYSEIRRARFYVTEPSVTLDAAFGRVIRASMGLGYLALSNSQIGYNRFDAPHYTYRDFNGIEAIFGLTFFAN